MVHYGQNVCKLLLSSAAFSATIRFTITRVTGWFSYYQNFRELISLHVTGIWPPKKLNFTYGGGSNIGGESLSYQLHFRSACKTEKKASAQGSLKFRAVSRTWKREKTRLKKVS